MKNLLKNLDSVVKAENSHSNSNDQTKAPVNVNNDNNGNDNDSTISKAAELTQTLAYKMFTYLLPWGVDNSVDNMCKTSLHLTPPNPEVTFAVTGYVLTVSEN